MKLAAKSLSLVVTAILLFAFSTEAQRWKKFRHEVWFGLGATNVMGELGGGSEEASDLFLDFDYQSSRYCVSGGYRYKLNETISARGGLMYGIFTGSDEFSGDIFRRQRNLSFRTPIIELTAVGEVYFIREKLSNRYRVRGIKGSLSNGLSAYFFGGIGGFWFNPKGQFNGDWYALQPIGTEGQGLPNEEAKYRRISLCIPMGIGAKYTINKNWALTLEYNFRFTFTDYLDDVSTSYADPAVVAANSSNPEATAFFVDPSVGLEFEPGEKMISTAPGVQRGDPTTNDTYMFATIGLSYKFISRKVNRPKF